MLKQLYSLLLRPKEVTLFHPESPGLEVKVTRTRIGRLFKDPLFATLKECARSSIKECRFRKEMHL